MTTVKFANANSFWYKRLDDAAPLVSDGSDTAAKLARQIRYNKTNTTPRGFYDPAFEVHVNQDSYSAPIWQVPAGQPTTKVQWIRGNGNGPPADHTFGAGLQTLLDHVPLPLDSGLVLNAGGTDSAGMVWQPSTDTLWEFFRLRKNYTNPYDGITYPWSCGYAGVIQNASQSRGIFPNNWGSSATSCSISCGTIQMSEIAAGVINHVVRVGIPVTAGPYTAHYAPATRNDSMTLIPGQSVQPVLTTLTATAALGASTIALAAVPAGYFDGRQWRIDFGLGNAEIVTITSINTGTGVATLAAPLVFTHTTGANLQISANTDAVKEGALLRFPHNVTIPAGLDPFAQMLMIAIRDYGMIVDDSSGVVSWYVESTNTLNTPYQLAGMTSNPFPGSYTGTVPNFSIINIPWESLQHVQYVPATLAPPGPAATYWKLARQGGVPTLLKQHLV